MHSSKDVPASIWHDTIARRVRALHLGSVRNQILAFAVLATLIPTLVMSVVSYQENRESLSETIAAELRGTTSEAAREIDSWVDERLDALRVSAGSYVVTENLARIQGRDGDKALSRLRAYLNSLRERFPDQEALLILDTSGRILASSSGRTGSTRLSAEGLTGLKTGEALVGDGYWDGALGRAVIVLAVPIREADGRFVAAFAAKLNLHAVADLLQRLSPHDSGDIAVLTDQGKLIIRSRVSSAELMRTKLPEAITGPLFDREGQTVSYKRADGREVMGALRRVPRLRWAAVAEVPREEGRVDRLRSSTGLLIAALLAIVGLLAWILASLTARPLGRLTAAAAKVAAGDLTIELPAGGIGEVGYLTRVFNTLVARLRERESQAELERLSVTDALTGLYNRRHLMGTLASEVQRSRRLRRPVSVLLADVDHFKQYNDTHGHPAGDVALAKIADILRKTTRGVDCVARYGGEEFLVLLLETTVATAAIVAERIRAQVAAEEFAGGMITVSIGVAECPSHGDTPESLIESADAALYEAKDGGRNRVIAAGGQERKRRRKGVA
ncbi:MAG TPA: GGDEF domain-containing protein [Myxococcales bacterium]|nr:GGDEF domain-containing protein [Myxococcales bacterium]